MLQDRHIAKGGKALVMLSVMQGSCESQFYDHCFDPTRNQTQATLEMTRADFFVNRTAHGTEPLAQ